MSFAKLTGNHVVRSRLQRMVASGHTPPSLLFTGPEGVGKLAAAVSTAKALNCVGTPQTPGDACDVCRSCLRIERGDYADVRQIRPGGKGGQVTAPDVRPVVAESPYRPFEGKKRVYIFEEAHRMNPTAANMLLKTLEEPPPWTLLILVTAHETALLPTLVSRCRKIRFLPLMLEEVVKQLTQDHDLSRKDAWLAAAVSRGSLSRALVTETEAVEALREEALRLASVPAEGASRSRMLPWADELSRHSELVPLLRLLLALARDLACAAGGGTAAQSDIARRLEVLSERMPLPVWLEAYRRVEQALYDIEVRYANKRITLEQLLLGLEDLDRDAR
ncbi:MAG: ATP-binding protein [Acidobacteriota bacterium]